MGDKGFQQFTPAGLLIKSIEARCGAAAQLGGIIFRHIAPAVSGGNLCVKFGDHSAAHGIEVCQHCRAEFKPLLCYVFQRHIPKFCWHNINVRLIRYQREQPGQKDLHIVIHVNHPASTIARSGAGNKKNKATNIDRGEKYKSN